MVSASGNRHAPAGRRGGWLLVELAAAMAVLVTILISVAVAMAYQQRVCRQLYEKAVAMEIVDGEAEVLAAGEGRAYPDGTHTCHVVAAAAESLPPGDVVVTVARPSARVEWVPAVERGAPRVVREVTIP